MKQAIVVVVALTLLSPAAGMAGEMPGGGGEAVQGTTVKSGKSNSSERIPGDGGDERATTVKGSKSNSSERAVGEPGTTVKGSKSNTSE
jgi:hypothetical protein